MDLAIAAGAYYDLMSVMIRLRRDAPVLRNLKCGFCSRHIFIPLFPVLLYFFVSRFIVELAPIRGLHPESGYAPYRIFSSAQESVASY